MYLRQNHNSVLGIREIALDQGGTFVAIPESELNEETCNRFIGGDPCTAGHKRNVLLTKFPESTYNLFAFPAEVIALPFAFKLDQDNFAGVKYPLDWINMFKSHHRGEEGTGHWLTLLDAAAYVPCNDLDLSLYTLQTILSYIADTQQTLLQFPFTKCLASQLAWEHLLCEMKLQTSCKRPSLVVALLCSPPAILTSACCTHNLATGLKTERHLSLLLYVPFPLT